MYLIFLDLIIMIIIIYDILYMMYLLKDHQPVTVMNSHEESILYLGNRPQLLLLPLHLRKKLETISPYTYI